MELVPSVAKSLYTKYSQIFQQSILDTEIFWPNVATLFNSTTETEQHIWMDRIPQMRQWNGDRVIRNASLRSYSLTNTPWELTMGLDEFKVKDNKIDAFAMTVQLMASQTKKWPDTLIFGPAGAIVNGASFTTYDGQPFWSTSHPINPDNQASATQSNFATSAPLNAANFFTGFAAMTNYVGADGLPLYTRPDLLVTTAANEAIARQILNTTFIAPTAALGMNAAGVQQQNPLVGMVDLLIVPDMAGITSVGGHSGTPWMLLDSSKPVKPFIFQLRESATFVMDVRPDSPSVFARHELQYGTRTRGAGGFGPYFLAYLGIG